MPPRPEPRPTNAQPRPRPGVVARERGAERRLRASGGPADKATYTCGCGAVFEADVSTQVACPACGAAQAW